MRGREPPDATEAARAYGQSMETKNIQAPRPNVGMLIGLALGHVVAALVWFYASSVIAFIGVARWSTASEGVAVALLTLAGATWIAAAVAIAIRWWEGRPAARFVGLWLAGAMALSFAAPVIRDAVLATP
jgi:hypothetical protein